MNFKVQVNSESEFDISTKLLSTFNAIKTSSGNYHILYQNKSYEAEITNFDFNKKTYEITLNNKRHQVKIWDALDILIKDMGFSLGTVKHIGSIKAPMPGLILDISVTVGQSVKEDDALLILEAMKMENIITSPRQGIIKSIAVKTGDAVDKNTLLIEFE